MVTLSYEVRSLHRTCTNVARPKYLCIYTHLTLHWLTFSVVQYSVTDDDDDDDDIFNVTHAHPKGLRFHSYWNIRRLELEISKDTSLGVKTNVWSIRYTRVLASIWAALPTQENCDFLLYDLLGSPEPHMHGEVTALWH